MKDRAAKLKQLLDYAHSPNGPLGGCITTPSPATIEVMGRFAFDWLLIDMEHSILGDNTQVADLARAADLTGLPWFVKVAKPEHLRARDAMDAGAWGVMFPHINSADQLKELIAEIKFPPTHGSRGFCSVSRAMWHIHPKYPGAHGNQFGDVMRDTTLRHLVHEYRDFVNEHMWVIPTVETVQAVENLDEILAVPGIDIVHIGFEDLAMSLNGANDIPAAMKLAMEVGMRIRKAGKVCMTFVVPDEPPPPRMPNSMTYVVDMACFVDGAITTLRKYGRRRAEQ